MRALEIIYISFHAVQEHATRKVYGRIKARELGHAPVGRAYPAMTELRGSTYMIWVLNQRTRSCE